MKENHLIILMILSIFCGCQKNNENSADTEKRQIIQSKDSSSQSIEIEKVALLAMGCVLVKQ